MKKALLSFMILLFGLKLYAQNVNDEIEILRDMAAAERRALIAENLILNEDESNIFWPVYDEYRAKMKKVGTARIENIQKYADNYENMANEVAIDIMKSYNQYNTDYLNIRKSFMEKLIKELSPKLVFRFFQIENKVDAMINFDLSAEIPLIIKD